MIQKENREKKNPGRGKSMRESNTYCATPDVNGRGEDL